MEMGASEVKRAGPVVAGFAANRPGPGFLKEASRFRSQISAPATMCANSGLRNVLYVDI
jgi:hypothetical protein